MTDVVYTDVSVVPSVAVGEPYGNEPIHTVEKDPEQSPPTHDTWDSWKLGTEDVQAPGAIAVPTAPVFNASVAIPSMPTGGTKSAPCATCGGAGLFTKRAA